MTEEIKHAEVLKDFCGDYETGFQEGLRDALNAAIKALEGERWIPVGEALPEEGMEVLVIEAGFCHSIVSREDGKWLNRYGVEVRGFTHWRHLPEGPK